MTALQINHYDEIAEILLASPEKKNTLDDDLSLRFLEALDSAELDSDVRAVIIGSTGGILTAGGSLEMLGVMAENAQDATELPKLRHRLRQNMRVVERLWDFDKPVVAAVDGACVGAGIGWVAACDVRLASERAFFDTAYLNLGLGTDFGVTWLLTQSVGSARALDWILRPRGIPAAEAQVSGLIGAVHTAEELMTSAHQTATLLAQTDPAVIQGLRRGSREADELSLSEALDSEAERFVSALHSARLPVRKS